MNALPPPQPLTRLQAAERLQVHVRTIDAWIRAGKIRVARICRTIRIPASEIERLLNPGGTI